ncbi:UNVERIFIED_ORG: Regulator of Chromosome Condensation (RCC1) repeat protein [Nocardia globerula]|uniref:Regulator of Chromosome Condensation (RCC1) repeat protein n=1 Tax=Nocardia globerula TaxID=1818 RepID=A0A652YSU2_NOCGL|nr:MULTISPECIES: putative Ig domain-containing protein [Rhodococcus]NMD61502.1 hypothetical protein [Nocardia globerula]PVX66947.1 Regulator of Chromosome Condensation (RCC1) repeat protein [Rhodococcus globerulus]RZL27048.1 MAG: hypothetical protein EOP31_00550 [Rhodococcus sp. (in: high G+C Gram-positive bacteria)]
MAPLDHRHRPHRGRRLRGLTALIAAGALALAAATTAAAEGVPVTDPGTITGWGYGVGGNNDNGQLDNFPAGGGYTAIAAGYSHSLALTADGSIVGWGNNNDGQLDNIPAGSGHKAIAVGAFHSVALTADGTIVAWGASSLGQLANIPVGNGYKAIAAGGYHSLALTADGTVVGWGYNYWKQANTLPGNGYKAIAAGSLHSLALTADGAIVGWGYNYEGQTNTPTGNGYTTIASGGFHGLALTADGTITTWGQSGNGLGTVPRGNGYTAIGGGDFHSLALTAEGTIAEWGSSGGGQLPAPTGTGYTAIAGGGNRSLALKTATASAFTDAGPVTVNGIAGTAISHAFTTTGNPTPVVTATGLPAGLTLSETGALTGTPTTEGSFPFTVSATNGVGNPATLNATLIVAAAPAAPMFTDAGPVTLDAVAGTALTREFTVTGNPAPTITVIDPAKLPTGMVFTNGTLSGTPAAAGSYTFTLNATNGVNPDLTLVVTVNVAEAPITPEQPTTGSLGSLEFTGFGS